MGTVTIDTDATSNGAINGYNTDETTATSLCERCIVAFSDYILLLRLTDRPNRYMFDVSKALSIPASKFSYFAARNHAHKGAHLAAKVSAHAR